MKQKKEHIIRRLILEARPIWKWLARGATPLVQNRHKCFDYFGMCFIQLIANHNSIGVLGYSLKYTFIIIANVSGWSAYQTVNRMLLGEVIQVDPDS